MLMMKVKVKLWVELRVEGRVIRLCGGGVAGLDQGGRRGGAAGLEQTRGGAELHVGKAPFSSQVALMQTTQLDVVLITRNRRTAAADFVQYFEIPYGHSTRKTAYSNSNFMQSIKFSLGIFMKEFS